MWVLSFCSDVNTSNLHLLNPISVLNHSTFNDVFQLFYLVLLDNTFTLAFASIHMWHNFSVYYTLFSYLISCLTYLFNIFSFLCSCWCSKPFFCYSFNGNFICIKPFKVLPVVSFSLLFTYNSYNVLIFPFLFKKLTLKFKCFLQCISLLVLMCPEVISMHIWMHTNTHTHTHTHICLCLLLGL
jgi:hypothetical protein